MSVIVNQNKVELFPSSSEVQMKSMHVREMLSSSPLSSPSPPNLINSESSIVAATPLRLEVVFV